MRYTRRNCTLWFAEANSVSLVCFYASDAMEHSCQGPISCTAALQPYTILLFLDEGTPNVSGISVDEQNHAG